ncbi:YqaJ viral recombinase family protein [Endozoicomonas gorgoniicola]|uniref:YqaJ viral recombinase family protein n=1 Tax=Endozoicomonas gorgoniicola TaxID=1234144 RepID=A0ABT3MTK5_9GAMM|nr:YqaJ viral recombinase family protein [Endozoicomonas gorgoniicola]MCW7552720.1 YqaJ viral recombinase family protein [Endozoicomonas gorgoniicola]
MKQVNIEQRSQAWLDWRRCGVSASDAAVILGLSPYKSRWQLWLEKRGSEISSIFKEPDLSANPHVLRGMEQEDDARNQMEQALNDAPLLPVCAEWEQNPVLRASFDGLTKDGVPVELKCPTQKVYDEVKTLKDKSEGYRRAFYQVQFQILVADSQLGWLCFYRQGLPLLPVCIRRDDALIQQLQQEAIDFWNRVEEGDEPDKDPNLDVYVPTEKQQRNQWQQLAMAYRQRQKRLDKLKGELDAGKSHQKQLQQQLQQLMGDFKAGEFDGLRVFRSTCSGTVDYQKALESLCQKHNLTLPNPELFRRKSRQQVKVTLVDKNRQDSDSTMETIGGDLLVLNQSVSNQSFYF